MIISMCILLGMSLPTALRQQLAQLDAIVDSPLLDASRDAVSARMRIREARIRLEALLLAEEGAAPMPMPAAVPSLRCARCRRPTWTLVAASDGGAAVCEPCAEQEQHAPPPRGSSPRLRRGGRVPA